MFVNLQVALTVVWAGQVQNTKPGGHHTATQMGNGIFPEEKQSAATFYDLQVRDGGGKWDSVTDLNNFKDSRYCYDSMVMSLFIRDAFHFGGPGRGSSCM
ncbi:hypothetical protein AMTR_s00016p00044740 [Amborella trichopoda]|uniref:Neprosin PEP catalytic domain-containing protein n=1 Tax=Amborella trichopoda TaxID=13333 RepID=W1PDS1_AMBTC|nr:hypothetical protein AMTR_s00016p00044740 [Amborella trichopoda]